MVLQAPLVVRGHQECLVPLAVLEHQAPQGLQVKAVAVVVAVLHQAQVAVAGVVEVEVEFLASALRHRLQLRKHAQLMP